MIGIALFTFLDPRSTAPFGPGFPIFELILDARAVGTVFVESPASKKSKKRGL